MNRTVSIQVTRFLVRLITGWLLANSVLGDELKPFANDVCSAFPDGTPDQKNLWLNCCQAHDLAYWQGGTRQQRRQADSVLTACVSEVGQPEIAKLMLAGVRVGGSPYVPTGFRWGYGWNYPRFYRALTDRELEEVQKKTGKLEDSPQH